MSFKTPDYYISYAENMHDSCITVANKREVLAHLELERFFHTKRYRIQNKDLLASIIALLINQYSIYGEIQFIVSRHTGEALFRDFIADVLPRFSKRKVAQVEHLDCHA